MDKRIEVQANLRLVYDPKMDTLKDIENRIRREINTMMSHGQLEGCEHGAQVVAWELEFTTSLSK